MLSEEVVDSMARRLDIRCPLSIKMARHGMVVEPDTAYIIPGGKHGEVMVEGNDAMIVLNKGPKVNYARPSIDVLMKSVAHVFGERTIGTLLTGMGWDGAEGMKAIKDAGGTTIAQDKETSAVFAMPKSAIDLGCVDKVAPLQDIPDEIVKILEKKG
jgi:two-component system chemotaxis response regulator CheB